MKDRREYETKIAMVPSDVAASDGVLTLAVLQLEIDTMNVTMNWLPQIFARPMPDIMKAILVEKLRHCAAVLESGELEERMRTFARVNDAEAGEA